MADKLLELQIVSPDRVFYEGKASMVEMVTTEGEIGVYAGHIPMTHILKSGILHIAEAAGTDKYAAVHDGFVEILPDKITILAEVAEWPGEIDVNRASDARVRAERRLNEKPDNLDITRAEMALRRALTRIELYQRYGK